MTSWFRIPTLRTFTLGWLLAVCLGLTACGGGGDAGTDSGGTGPLASKSVAPGATQELPATELQHLTPFTGHALLAPTEQVIRSEAEWQAFWSQHPDNPVPALEGVDFSQQMLLAVVRAGGGCGLKMKITSVAPESTATGPGWVVGFTEEEVQVPAYVACVTTVSTVVDIVVWPRSDAPVRFVNLGAKP